MVNIFLVSAAAELDYEIGSFMFRNDTSISCKMTIVSLKKLN